MSRFTHFLEIIGQKQCLFGSKTVFLGQEVHYFMVNIAYFTELNLQICDYAQKWHVCRENCKYALDENFHGHFCFERLPSSATLINWYPTWPWNSLFLSNNLWKGLIVPTTVTMAVFNWTLLWPLFPIAGYRRAIKEDYWWPHIMLPVLPWHVIG